MPIKNVVTPANLGNEFDIGVIEANKIHIKFDGLTILRNATTGIVSTAPDVLTALSFNTATQQLSYTDEQAITTVIDLSQLRNHLVTTSPNSGAPGGVIQATVGGVPSNYYSDADGDYSATITLPVPPFNGARFIVSHQATANASVQTVNTALGAALVMSATRRGAEFVAINGRWLLTTP